MASKFGGFKGRASKWGNEGKWHLVDRELSLTSPLGERRSLCGIWGYPVVKNAHRVNCLRCLKKHDQST